jgi:hypothetical protein
MNVRYRVTLTQYERNALATLLSGGKHPARKLKRAQILLAADAGVGDEDIALSVGSAARPCTGPSGASSKSWHDGLTVDCYAGLRAGAWCSAASHCIQNISGVPPGTFRPPRGGLNMQHNHRRSIGWWSPPGREKAPAHDAARVHHTSQRRDRVIDPTRASQSEIPRSQYGSGAPNDRLA